MAVGQLYLGEIDRGIVSVLCCLSTLLGNHVLLQHLAIEAILQMDLGAIGGGNGLRQTAPGIVAVGGGVAGGIGGAEQVGGGDLVMVIGNVGDIGAWTVDRGHLAQFIIGVIGRAAGEGHRPSTDGQYYS